MKTNFSIIILIVSILFIGCDQDPIDPPIPSCNLALLVNTDVLTKPDTACRLTPFPPQPPIFFRSRQDSVTWEIIAANPDNPFEVIYKKKISRPVRYECWTRNLCTGENHLILDGNTRDIDWGKNGWLVLSIYNDGWQVYKMKYDGSELTKLTQFGNNVYPKWNSDESKILYYQTDDEEHIYEMDSDGQNKKVWLELPGKLLNLSYFSWSPSDSGFIFTDHSLGTYYVDVNSMDSTLILDKNSIPGKVIWMNDGQHVLWTTRTGVYQVNPFTGAQKTIAEVNCYSTFFQLGESTSNDDLFYLQLGTNYFEDPNTIYTTSSPHLFNLSSLQSLKVDLP